MFYCSEDIRRKLITVIYGTLGLFSRNIISAENIFFISYLNRCATQELHVCWIQWAISVNNRTPLLMTKMYVLGGST